MDCFVASLLAMTGRERHGLKIAALLSSSVGAFVASFSAWEDTFGIPGLCRSAFWSLSTQKRTSYDHFEFCREWPGADKIRRNWAVICMAVST